MRNRGILYVWLVPLLWCVCSVASFAFPGDEYGIWAVGSIAGIWILGVIGNVGDIHGLLPWVLLSGAAVMAVIGFALDRLRVPPVLPLVVVLVVAFGVCASLTTFGGRRPIWTSRDVIVSYGLFGLLVGMYAAILVSAPVMVIAKVCERRQKSD